jgi:hypothetical protein
MLMMDGQCMHEKPSQAKAAHLKAVIFGDHPFAW